MNPEIKFILLYSLSRVQYSMRFYEWLWAGDVKAFDARWHCMKIQKSIAGDSQLDTRKLVM